MSNILFICNANMNRSPKAEELVNRYSEENEAKSAGLHPIAIIPISYEAIKWADIIVLMNESKDKQKTMLFEMFSYEEMNPKDIRVLEIPDIYPREDPELEKVLIDKLKDESLM